MKKKYHFIGIGGIGMSALCRIALQRGDMVQGSDIASSHYTDLLRKKGVQIFLGHRKEQIAEGFEVVHSSDIKSDNPEYQQAKKMNLTILHRSDLLEEFSRPYRTIYVAGTHGKTTTTALLCTIFLEAGLNPSFAIGGMLQSEKTNGRWGKGEHFILEADESDGSFLKGKPFSAIITNAEKEHLDYWKSTEGLEEGFKAFIQNVSKKELLFWCADDPTLKKMKPEGVSYGFSEDASFKVIRYSQNGFYLFFDAIFQGKRYENICLKLIGKHNVLNSLAVFALSLTFGISEEVIRKVFLKFSGISRRMEHLGRVNQVDFFDDYAHHPTEIFTTLNGLKKAVSPRRVVAVFQPHRYTRVRDLFNQFGAVFESADLVIASDIHSAGEKAIEGIDGKKLAEEIKKKRPVQFLAKEELGCIWQYLLPNDVVITLGAGDITKLGRKLCEEARESL